MAGAAAQGQMLRQVVVRPELAEHLMTTGDIGVPITAMCKRFPLVRKGRLYCICYFGHHSWQL